MKLRHVLMSFAWVMPYLCSFCLPPRVVCKSFHEFTNLKYPCMEILMFSRNALKLNKINTYHFQSSVSVTIKTGIKPIFSLILGFFFCVSQSFFSALSPDGTFYFKSHMQCPTPSSSFNLLTNLQFYKVTILTTITTYLQFFVAKVMLTFILNISLVCFKII